LSFAAGQAAAGTLSADAVALADSLLKAQALSAYKWVAALVLALTLVGSGAFAYHAINNERQPPAQTSPVAPPQVAEPADQLADAIESHVRQWQPTPDERRIDLIGWASDLRHARRLALASGRPIFLYTHLEGMAIGRCDGGPASMRASGLSNLWAIELLNRYYVPVYIPTAGYWGQDGTAPAEEKAELQRITQAIHRAKLASGDQLAIIMAPDGQVIDTMAGCHASQASNLIELLSWNICVQEAVEGETLVRPVPQSRPPQTDADALVLHLTARYLRRQGDELLPLPVRVGSDKASWRCYPAENWIVFDRGQSTKLLPAGPVYPGVSWQIDREVSNFLLKHFYPETEENDLAKNRIERSALRATVTRVEGDRARARIEGELRMKHRFTGAKDDDRYVEATILGYLDFEPGRNKIRALRLYTPQATYGADDFGLAVRSLP
jgi:hypothetical protein